MEKNCNNCKDFNKCGKLCPFPEVGCSDFNSLNCRRFVLLHFYLETNKITIVCFSDDKCELDNIKFIHPRYGSKRHEFIILKNNNNSNLNKIKDKNLFDMCQNVASYLSIGEYAMLKHSYKKASAWFERAKDTCCLAADILDNY